MKQSNEQRKWGEIAKKVQETKLRWYGQATRIEGYLGRRVMGIEGEINRRGRQKMRRFDGMRVNLREKGLSEEDVYDRAAWRQMSSHANLNKSDQRWRIKYSPYRRFQGNRHQRDRTLLACYKPTLPQAVCKQSGSNMTHRPNARKYVIKILYYCYRYNTFLWRGGSVVRARKRVGPFHLVAMPGEVKDPTRG